MLLFLHIYLFPDWADNTEYADFPSSASDLLPDQRELLLYY